MELKEDIIQEKNNAVEQLEGQIETLTQELKTNFIR